MKPVGMPPLYQPSLVADAILHVAEHPTRDILVGDAARALDFLQRLSPTLVNSLLQLAAFRLQRTSQPKSEDAPDNLYGPAPEHDRVKGDFDNLVIPSFLDWFDKNILVRSN
ncbi:hypothetical protein [Scytonema sp. UIC 10036]|uniref:hypothetical protein n=1 Tax=Scytonema sp. UIC 10036 TaxID=2304196 RepID=UPI001A9B1958